MTTPHKLVLTLLKALNTADLQLLANVIAPQFRGYDCAQAAPIQGLEGMSEYIQTCLGAFPDLNVKILDSQISAQGAAVHWTARGTHAGAWMNIPPTGRCVAVQGIWMLTIENGAITGARSQWDIAGLLRELGLLPDL